MAEIEIQVTEDGPYVITGHSIGGHVAFHMACRLQEEDEEVLFLGLLDPVAPHALPSRPVPAQRHLRRHRHQRGRRGQLVPRPRRHPLPRGLDP